MLGKFAKKIPMGFQQKFSNEISQISQKFASYVDMFNLPDMQSLTWVIKID